MKPIVFVKRVDQNPESLENQFERSFSTLALVKHFEKANAIFIKPNLTYPIKKRGKYSDPLAILWTAESLSESEFKTCRP